MQTLKEKNDRIKEERRKKQEQKDLEKLEKEKLLAEQKEKEGEGGESKGNFLSSIIIANIQYFPLHLGIIEIFLLLPCALITTVYATIPQIFSTAFAVSNAFRAVITLCVIG